MRRAAFTSAWISYTQPLKHVLLAVAKSRRLPGALPYVSHVMSHMMSHVVSHMTSHGMSHHVKYQGYRLEKLFIGALKNGEEEGEGERQPVQT